MVLSRKFWAMVEPTRQFPIVIFQRHHQKGTGNTGVGVCGKMATRKRLFCAVPSCFPQVLSDGGVARQVVGAAVAAAQSSRCGKPTSCCAVTQRAFRDSTGPDSLPWPLTF